MLLLLAACASPGPEATPPARADDTAADAVDTGDTGPAGPTGPEVPAPALTADEVGRALDEALAWQIPTFPAPARVFVDLMAQGGGCTPDPRFFEILDPLGCRAESGLVYSGAGGANASWDATGAVYTYELRADLVIVDAAGYPFEVGGDVDGIVTVGDGGLGLSQQFLGSFHYEPAGLWLGQGTSGSAWIEAWFGDEGDIVATLDGGYDLGGTIVYFDGFEVGGACGANPAGAVRLRDASGYWYVLTLSDACDTCGDVVYAGTEALGTACVDPSVAMRALADDVAAYMADDPPVWETE